MYKNIINVIHSNRHAGSPHFLHPDLRNDESMNGISRSPEEIF